MTDALRRALAYAEPAGRCSVPARAEVPATGHGYLDATTDPSRSPAGRPPPRRA